MCGRYYRISDKQKIAEAFLLGNQADMPLEVAPSYNIAPSTMQPVIVDDRDSGERSLRVMRWGLIPGWAKDTKALGLSTINAKAETLMDKPMWRTPLKKHRCLVLADGFYEWRRSDQKTKIPYACSLKGGGPFGFAGIWDAWKDAEGRWLESFAIITTEQNEIMAPIHNRMPVILHAKDYDRWLDPEETEPPPIDLLRPYESEQMQVALANPLVGNVRNNGPEMLIGA